MGKSILVIDTPKNCQECPLELDIGIERKNGRVETLLNANICRGCGKENFESNGKPNWCPLEEIKDNDREEIQQYRATSTVEECQEARYKLREPILWR